MTRIVLATNNPHKIRELKALLADLKVEIATLSELPSAPELREDGPTFRDNALQKARAVHAASGLPAVADDSGLEVFYLNSRPGVLSARYAGVNTTDERNNEKLLAEMRGVAPRRRRAQFRAFTAFVDGAREIVTEGVCPGRLGESPRGTNGFGYDPIFLPDGFARTYAELSAEEKNQISHRAKAIGLLKEALKSLQR
jgi:XTP/dITP diphosphohydrolase